ncbi:MAG: D-hexose-6-phosphate mutarotase [bacterium]|nr:D-hexose-6-phosphate mutarotase [bacterium]
MIDRLNQSHAIDERLRFREGPGELISAQIETAASTGTIALHGAQVLSWTPAGHEDLLWLSGSSPLRADKAIRGGIPICWPWFGNHESDASKPAHGFARTSAFQVRRSFETADGCGLELALTDSATSRALWPHAFELRVCVEMGTALRVDLEMHNTSDETVCCGAALHSYFRVGDVERIAIEGLSGLEYLDKVEDFARKQQHQAPRIRGETDRVYLAADTPCTVDDPTLDRRLHVDKRGSRTTVLWNPGLQKARSMADFEDAGWRDMVCVEAANAFDDCRELAPGAHHVLGTQIRVQTR